MSGISILRTYLCSCNAEGEILEKRLRSNTIFHKNGEIREEITIENEEVVGKTVQEINDKGYISSICMYNEFEECTHEEELTYTEEGNPLSRKVKYDGGAFDLTHFRYDQEGKLLEEETKDEHGEVTTRILYKYDEKGRLVSEKCINEEEKEVDWAVEYKYIGDSSQIAEERRYGQDEEVLEIGLYQYDEAGNLISEKVLNDKGRLIRELNTDYDEKGRKEEVNEQDFERNRKLQRMYQYDEDFLSEEQVYEGEQLLQKISYQYDSFGNATEELRLSIVSGMGDFYAYTATVYEMEYFEEED